MNTTPNYPDELTFHHDRQTIEEVDQLTGYITTPDECIAVLSRQINRSILSTTLVFFCSCWISFCQVLLLCNIVFSKTCTHRRAHVTGHWTSRGLVVAPLTGLLEVMLVWLASPVAHKEGTNSEIRMACDACLSCGVVRTCNSGCSLHLFSAQITLTVDCKACLCLITQAFEIYDLFIAFLDSMLCKA